MDFDSILLAKQLNGGGGSISADDFATRTEPSGSVTITSNSMVAYGLAYSVNMTSLTADSVTTIRDAVLIGCSGLTSISFANATTVSGTKHFYGCSNLKSVNLPKLTFLNDQGFQGCSKLEFLDLPKVTGLNHSGIFRGCNKFATLVLRNTSVVPINNDVFANTPFAGYNSLTGVVYVPSDLISSYQLATNWSTLYNNGTCSFVAIEGSAYE